MSPGRLPQYLKKCSSKIKTKTSWANAKVKLHSQVHFGLYCIRKQNFLGQTKFPVLTCPDFLTCPDLTCPDLTCPDLSCPDLTCPDLVCPVTKLLVETFQTPSRHPSDTLQTLSRHLSDTIQTLSRHISSAHAI